MTMWCGWKVLELQATCAMSMWCWVEMMIDAVHACGAIES